MSISTGRLNFKLEAQSIGSRARACRFTTLHNEVLTPVFMPVATFAALRTQDMRSVDRTGFPVLLANTYHLLLRPGPDVFRSFGGIHKFMNWDRSVLTDSGGYQIFSLSSSIKMSEDGAEFKSYIDGKKIFLSPELSIDTQKIIGSDIMMALDQCVPSTSDEKICTDALELTARWAERSLAARGGSSQSLFGIVQGGCFTSLRKKSAAQITSLPFDGFAIGGLAVGEGSDERKDMTELTASLLPKDLPRYLMGVGTPIDLLEAVHRGVDMFDCIIPTAFAHQGVVFTSKGRIELRRGVYKLDSRAIDENCSCAACSGYSRSYIHHLIKTGEYFGSNLAGIHNLTFYKKLMDDMRSNILANTFDSFYKTNKETLAMTDDEHPRRSKTKRGPASSRTLGNFEVVSHEKGFHSIKQKSSGEIMHSVNEPIIEAKSLYVDQSNMHTELMEDSTEPFTIWDVGLGSGTNAMAAIFEYEKIYADTKIQRPLQIISFENDLDALRLTMKHPSLFHHIRHSAPASILSKSEWLSKNGNCSWRLVEGDFRTTFEAAALPDCIFYDPFSLHTDTELWGYNFFSKMHRLLSEKDLTLITYSASTGVRSSLLAAGFFVGRGVSTGPKKDTTIAVTKISKNISKIDLLGNDWLSRWERSSAGAQQNLNTEESELIEKKIRLHPQFKNL